MKKRDQVLKRGLALLVTVVTVVALLSGCFDFDTVIQRPKVTFPKPSRPSVATQPNGTTAAPEPDLLPDLLPGLPEELKSNVYLMSRGKGDCKAMVGDVLLTVIFASDSESTWSDARMKAMQTHIGVVEERIEQDAAAWGATLELTVEFKTGTATSGQLELGNSQEWVDSVVKSAGLGSRAEVNQKLEELRGVDEAPIAIFVDRAGRSFASSTSSTTGAEYAICYKDAEALYHELNHVFGAKDFYYPLSVKELAETHLPDSIMINSGEGEMEALTAYLIGWTDTPAEGALAFLRATAHLTKEQLEAERDKEQYTGYVTDFQKGDAIYTGYLLEGQLHGYGTRTSLDGNSYTGDWDHGVRHGTGTSIWANGDSYTGDWNQGVRHGKGTYTWADGNSYTGDWVEGQRTGKGIWTSAEGDRYEGDFLNGKLHGQGTYVWVNGNSYTGGWVESQRTGKGTWTSAEGNRYEGDFLNGKFHGQGTYVWVNGNSYTGDWVESQRTGKGTWTSAEGSRYVGDFQSGKLHGQGTYTWANGDSYSGGWVEDHREGYGVYQWTNGARYEGQFANNQRNGQGTMTYANGTVKTGLWENGDFKG